MKQFLIILQLLIFNVGMAFSQGATVADPVKLVRAGNKTTYGSGQNAVAEYLRTKGIAPGEGETYRRAAFKVLIDHTGKVVGAEKFFGGISTELDGKIATAFLEMPNWKTSIAENEQSVVYIVVTLQNQSITTELY